MVSLETFLIFYFPIIEKEAIRLFHEHQNITQFLYLKNIRIFVPRRFGGEWVSSHFSVPDGI